MKASKTVAIFGFCFEAFGSRHASPLEQWSWKLRWYGSLSLDIAPMCKHRRSGGEVAWHRT